MTFQTLLISYRLCIHIYIYLYIHIYKTLASRKNEMWLLKALSSSPLLLEEVVPGSLPQVRSGNKMEVG